MADVYRGLVSDDQVEVVRWAGRRQGRADWIALCDDAEGPEPRRSEARREIAALCAEAIQRAFGLPG